MKSQCAAISLRGRKFVIVLVGMDLVDAPGEADMAIDSLQQNFGGAPVILMAQREDGSPRYYGDEELVRSLAEVPVDEMPWQEFSV